MRKRYRSTRGRLLEGMRVKLVVSRMVLQQVFVSKFFKKIFSSIFLKRLRQGSVLMVTSKVEQLECLPPCDEI